VNRPFYAIGVLLAAMAAAMLLVSGTGPRPVARPAKLAPRRVPADQSVPTLRAGRGEVFVLILPAEPEPTEPQYTYSSGCGWDRTTGEIYAEPLIVRLPPVPVHTVTDLPRIRPIMLDFRSNYDAAYDAAVYGKIGVPLRGSADASPGELWDTEVLDELDPALHLLRDVMKQLPAGPKRPKGPRNRLANAKTQPPSQPQAPTWQDYEEWFDSLHNVAEQDGPAGELPDDPAHLGRQALQYAARALHHVAELLRAAAEELERSGNAAVASQPGGASRSAIQK
jgi:hypothetical protein